MTGFEDETVARTVRAFFAPVERNTNAPTTFDPACGFDLNSPPVPWLPAGEVHDFKRSSTTRFGAMTAGPKGAVGGQFRSGLEARVAFDFCTWNKLQMSISGGSQHMNVLAEVASASGAPSGGVAVSPVALLNGSSATELVLGTGVVDAFSEGDRVVADLDYSQQIGYVGAPIHASFVKDPADVMRDRDYLRRISFNIAKVKEKTSTSLILDQPLLGGPPAEGMSVQKVVAFVDREGGSFFQEWSALFVVDAESGGRLCFYYPRLQAAGAASESEGKLNTFSVHRLHAEMIALPIRDELDAEQAVCWRSWMPA